MKLVFQQDQFSFELLRALGYAPCHAGALTLFHQRAFDWLDDALPRAPRA